VTAGKTMKGSRCLPVKLHPLLHQQKHNDACMRNSATEFLQQARINLPGRDGHLETMKVHGRSGAVPLMGSVSCWLDNSENVWGGNAAPLTDASAATARLVSDPTMQAAPRHVKQRSAVTD